MFWGFEFMSTLIFLFVIRISSTTITKSIGTWSKNNVTLIHIFKTKFNKT